jgi:hypothetical protein
MNWYGAGVRQHDTHRELTGQSEQGTPRADVLSLDAIIVPGARPAAYLDHAVTLAKLAKCTLVVLCSQALHGREVKEYLAARSFSETIVIDLPPGYSHPLLDFRGLLDIRDQLPSACGFRATDLSVKRNLGLVLAKMLGWRRVFFLDDDIRDIAYPDLQHTVNMLGRFAAAGMWVTEFPDNSIVCHANRTTGGSQDVFVSGAVLAVDCESDIGFFPDIYNEDWLFFFDAAANGELGNSYLKATQLYYYPFANAERAAWQEFGDVIAEGLYSLLHLGRGVTQATSAHWASFIEARRNFLEAALTRAQDAPLDTRDDITASLRSALKCLSEITPDLCARYVEAWRQDLKAWKRRWAKIRVMQSVDAALAELGLETTPTDSTKRILHPLDMSALTHAPGPVAIPTFDTLRRMSDHFSVQHLGGPAADQMRSAGPPAGRTQGSRRRHRHRRQGWLATTVQTYCQSVATRIAVLKRMSTNPNRRRERAIPARWCGRNVPVKFHSTGETLGRSDADSSPFPFLFPGDTPSRTPDLAVPRRAT